MVLFGNISRECHTVLPRVARETDYLPNTEIWISENRISELKLTLFFEKFLFFSWNYIIIRIRCYYSYEFSFREEYVLSLAHQ